MKFQRLISKNRKIGENFMRQTNFEMIDKKLAKKNAELQEIRETRQKLADKEKEICASIDKLQNQKIEVIFEQVKKEIKSENLKVSSESIMPLLEVLRNTRQIEDDSENEESSDEKSEIIATENMKTKEIGNMASRLDSISDIVKS